MITDTSLVYVISATDFLGAAAKVANRDYRLVEMYTFVALVYFLMSFTLSLLVKRLEKNTAIASASERSISVSFSCASFGACARDGAPAVQPDGLWKQARRRHDPPGSRQQPVAPPHRDRAGSSIRKGPGDFSPGPSCLCR